MTLEAKRMVYYLYRYNHIKKRFELVPPESGVFSGNLADYHYNREQAHREAILKTAGGLGLYNIWSFELGLNPSPLIRATPNLMAPVEIYRAKKCELSQELENAPEVELPEPEKELKSLPRSRGGRPRKSGISLTWRIPGKNTPDALEFKGPEELDSWLVLNKEKFLLLQCSRTGVALSAIHGTRSGIQFRALDSSGEIKAEGWTPARAEFFRLLGYLAY